MLIIQLEIMHIYFTMVSATSFLGIMDKKFATVNVNYEDNDPDLEPA